MIRNLPSGRILLGALLLALPLSTGCDYDNHATRTGAAENGFKPNDNGPNGSGSIVGNKLNAGGPGAPGTTAANPAADGSTGYPDKDKPATPEKPSTNPERQK